ncbi:hypothetical protein OH690_05735 [Escherichia coli]|nr:hypothetical protein [Escherichia coli]
MEAADRLRDEPLIFAIVGQGGGKARLEKMAQQRGLRNMQFFRCNHMTLYPHC